MQKKWYWSGNWPLMKRFKKNTKSLWNMDKMTNLYGSNCGFFLLMVYCLHVPFFLHQSLWFLGLITEDQITVIQITEAKLLSDRINENSSENWHFRYNLTFCNNVPNEKFSTLRKLHIIVYCQFLLIIFKITWLMERNWNKLKSIGGCL